MWKNFTDAFYLNFISDDRWHYIADGLKTTLIITFFACMMGIVLGFIVGMIRSTHDKTGKLKLLNILCKIYLTVIRGTPVVVQLLIIYFVVFGSRTKPWLQLRADHVVRDHAPGIQNRTANFVQRVHFSVKRDLCFRLYCDPGSY